MRFFTFECWSGDLKKQAAAIAEYSAYIDSVRSALPVPVIEFYEQHTLHDSRIRSLLVDAVSRTIRIVAFGWALGLDSGRQYRLLYSGLESIEVLGDREIPLGGPGGLGHLGYDEWQCLSSGLFEHRLLFSTGVEIVIVHESFSFETEPFGS